MERDGSVLIILLFSRFLECMHMYVDSIQKCNNKLVDFPYQDQNFENINDANMSCVFFSKEKTTSPFVSNNIFPSLPSELNPVATTRGGV